MESNAAGGDDAGDYRQILILESDDGRRRQIADASARAGYLVTAVRHIGDVERWPVGQIVITDVRHFTPWWKYVGAARVLVLAGGAIDGMEACARGANAWLPRLCSAEALVEVLRALGNGEAV